MPLAKRKRLTAVRKQGGDPEGRHLQVLLDVTRRLAAAHETDDILTLIVNEATRVLGAEAAGLRLIEGDEIVTRARTESAKDLMSRTRLRTGESLSGLVG